MAITSAANFTIENNSLLGNTSFIGSRGPNCSTDETTPTPAAFVIWSSNVSDSTIQSDFTGIDNGDGLTCIVPPEGGDYWPYGGNPATSTSAGSPSSTSSPQSDNGGGGLSGGAKAGIAIGVILGVAGIAALTFYIRRWALRRQAATQATWNNRSSYTQNTGTY